VPEPRISLKAAFQRVANAFRIQSRLEELGDKLLAALEKKDVPVPYRKCPHCGEHDLCLQDRHRYKPHFFSDQRYFHEKWRCSSCGHFEQNHMPERGIL